MDSKSSPFASVSCYFPVGRLTKWTRRKRRFLALLTPPKTAKLGDIARLAYMTEADTLHAGAGGTFNRRPQAGTDGEEAADGRKCGGDPAGGPGRNRYTVQRPIRWLSRTDVRWGPRFCSTAPGPGPPTPPLIHFLLGRPLCGDECRADVRWVRAELFSRRPQAGTDGQPPCFCSGKPQPSSATFLFSRPWWLPTNSLLPSAESVRDVCIGESSILRSRLPQIPAKVLKGTGRQRLYPPLLPDACPRHHDHL
jgi:hypothetical protein